MVSIDGVGSKSCPGVFPGTDPNIVSISAITIR
jgi:hypothetical protein